MGDIWKPQSGWAGVEYNVPVMLTQVAQGRLTINHYVKVQSENPAKAWSLWPRKGNLDVGADADVTIVDLEKHAVVDQAKGHSKNPNTPFHGWHVQGLPIYTIVRGRVVAKDGELAPGEPHGVFVKRQG
jgi:dihydroorotase-like cyclic amidohydrolase